MDVLSHVGAEHEAARDFAVLEANVCARGIAQRQHLGDERSEQTGVGQLVEIGVTRGRATKPGLKIGICGEHGGDPASIGFCQDVGLNYVSCSPYRVPIARLAAAQAALGARGGGEG